MKSYLEKKKFIFNQLAHDPKLGKTLKSQDTFPEPYCEDCNNVKAIVLGADPTNPQEKSFTYVFGLEDRNSPYFSSILKNLHQIGLNLN